MSRRHAVRHSFGAGRCLAALYVDGQLDDLLVDPPGRDRAHSPGAIHRGRIGRTVKGMKGCFVDLGDVRGFLREADGLAEGALIDVEIAACAEAGKALPVSRRLALRGRYAVATPGAPGCNISRALRAPEARARLTALAARLWPQDAAAGLILRTEAALADEDAIAADISDLQRRVTALERDGTAQGCLAPAPDAATLGWAEWPDAEWQDAVSAADASDLAEAIAQAAAPCVNLAAGAFMVIEPTRACVTVDVNTGQDFSPAAGLKATLAACRALPRALRIRGLGGQIVIDPAHAAKKDRPGIETALKSALRRCPVDTSLAGWTPLGHIELNRKRARRPLSELLPEGLP